MRSALLSFALCGLTLLTGFIGSAATEGQETVVSFDYQGRATVKGLVQGECESYGAVLAPTQVVRFEMGETTASHVTTWANKTTIRPDERGEIGISTPQDYERSAKDRHFAAGTYEITGREGSHIAFLPLPEAEAPAITLKFSGDDASWSSVREPLRSAPYLEDGPADSYPLIMNGLSFNDGSFPPGTRGFSIGNGTYTATGAALLHLRAVAFEGAGDKILLPEFPQTIRNETTPGNTGRITTYRMEELFIPVSELALTSSEITAVWGCTSLSMDVRGMLTVADASGVAAMGTVEQAFDRQVLTVEGTFSLEEGVSETSDYQTINAEATGSIRVLGIDFRVVALPFDRSDLAISLGILGLVGAGVGFWFKKSAPTLTLAILRHRRQGSLDHPKRRAILEIVREKKALHQKDIPDLLKGSRGQIRHHVEVLAADGLLRRLTIDGQVLVFPTGIPREAVIEEILRSHETLGAVHLLASEGIPRHEVVRRLASYHEVTDRTARKYVKKYETLCGQEREGRK